MNHRVNKINFARILKKTSATNKLAQQVIDQVTINCHRGISTIETVEESLDHLNNLILNHKIQLQQLRNNI